METEAREMETLRDVLEERRTHVKGEGLVEAELERVKEARGLVGGGAHRQEWAAGEGGGRGPALGEEGGGGGGRAWRRVCLWRRGTRPLA